MTQQDFVFRPASFFLLRVPLFPVHIFYDLCQEASKMTNYLLGLFQTNPELQEAVAIASPSLYRAIDSFIKNPTSDLKKINQTISGLFKYTTRMATRPTPFGLFSFVALGTWNKATSNELDLRDLKKLVRPDMEWLIQIIEHISQEAAQASKLYLQRNPFIKETLNRIHLPFRVNYKKNREKIYIKKTELVKNIIINTKDIIKQEDLINQILSKFPSWNRHGIIKVIQELLSRDILLSNFFPIILREHPFDDLLENLSSIYPNYSSYHSINEINKRIKEYQSVQIGQGLSLISSIENLMQKQAESTYLFELTTAHPQTVSLPYAVANELSHITELLWNISILFNRQITLSSYYKKFLEKYGVSRRVPLLELLDENKGLGIPESYLKGNLEENPELLGINKWEQWLIEEYVKALNNNQEEIVITDQMIETLIKNQTPCDAPPSIDLFCELIADAPSSIDGNDFLLHVFPSTGSIPGCASMGRFIHLLGEEANSKIKEFIREEEEKEPNTIFAEVSFLPLDPRAANVSIRPNLREWVLNVGTGFHKDKQILLEELFIGATDKHLFITFKDGHQRVMVNPLNAVNPHLIPFPIRFLRDVSNQSCQPFCPFYWGKWDTLSFLPRVRYRQTFLSLRQWRLTLSIIEASSSDDLDSLTKKIRKWVNNFNLPSIVWMTFGDDKRLLLNLKNDFHLKEIAHQLHQSKKPLILVEKIESKGWVKSNKGNHFAEIIVPMLRNKQNSRPTTFYPVAFDLIDFHHRYKVLGNDWVYIKIYMRSDEKDFFLTENLYVFVKNINSLLEKWFFIQYKDEAGWHIRVRFQLKEKEGLAILIRSIHDWTFPLKKEGLIKDAVFASYEREIERYGGEDAIELAESFFHADSETSLIIINAIQKNYFPFPSFIVASLSIVNILIYFNLDLNSKINFFEKMNLDRDLLAGFREWKAVLLNNLESVLQINDSNEKRATHDFLNQIFEQRKKSLCLYVNKIIKSSDLQSIVFSILHMHCNRILGIDSVLEKKACLFAYHGLLILKNKKTAIEN